MLIKRLKFSPRTTLFILLGLYLLVHLLFLTRFPAMHSDESWLSGLSRYMGTTWDFSVTEPFFDLKPRVPHAIRIIFHLIQAIFIQILDYQLFTVRLVSLLASVVCLHFFYRLTFVITGKSTAASLAAACLGLDLSFIYTAHLARPEMLMLACLISGAYFLIGRPHHSSHGFHDDLLASLITGLAIGIHPNSLIVAICFTLFYGYQIMIARQLRLTNLAFFLSVTCASALFFIGLSLYFNPGFSTDYFAYGQSQFKVLNPLIDKWSAYCDFYVNIFQGNTGTYALPNLRFHLILFGLTCFLTLAGMIIQRQSKLILPLLAIVGINLGILGIGRFNQTSIVLQIPFFYILLVEGIHSLSAPKSRTIVTITLILCLGFSAWHSIAPFEGDSYEDYLTHLARYVPKDQNTLASLNTEYYFQANKLYDFRNLSYLKQHQLTFAQYIQKNRIRYIIYPESLDWIYRQRPRWNSIYGSLYGYYPEMKRFFKENCGVAGQFTDRKYGVEIARYQDQRNWKITIYEVR